MSVELFEILREDIAGLKAEIRGTRSAVHDLRESVTREHSDHAARLTVLEANAKSDKTILGLPVLQFVNLIMLGVILAMSGYSFFLKDLTTGWIP